MNEEDLIDIEERAKKGFTGPQDVDALLKYTAGLGHKLAECWLLLDQIAKSHPDDHNILKSSAMALLRKQQCPGWKAVQQ